MPNLAVSVNFLVSFKCSSILSQSLLMTENSNYAFLYCHFSFPYFIKQLTVSSLIVYISELQTGNWIKYSYPVSPVGIHITML